MLFAQMQMQKKNQEPSQRWVYNLRWLIMFPVSFATCILMFIAAAPLGMVLEPRVGETVAKVFFETIVFSVAFVTGAMFAPNWRILSIVPQYFFLGYLGWTFYAEYTNPTYWEYIARETPGKIPALMIAIVGVFLVERWRKLKRRVHELGA